MAQIPRYTQRIGGGSPLNVPKQSFDAPVEAFGGGRARQVGQIGQTLQQTGQMAFSLEEQMRKAQERLQAEKDSAEVSAAITEFNTWVDDLMYNENSGLFFKTGKDADGLVAFAKKEKDKKFAEIQSVRKKNGASDRAIQEAMNRAETQFSNIQAKLAGHQVSELKLYNINSKQSEISSGMSIFDKTNISPSEMDAQFDVFIKQPTEALAALTGKDPREAIREAKAELFAKKTAYFINNGEIAKAEEMLNRYGDIEGGKSVLGSDAVSRLRNAVDDKKMIILSDEKATEVLSKFSSFSDARKYINKEIVFGNGKDEVKNKEFRARIIPTVRAEYEDRKAKKIEYDNIQLQNGFIAITTANSPIEAQKAYRELSPEVQAKLSGTISHMLEKWGVDAQSDAETYFGVYGAIKAGTLTNPADIDGLLGKLVPSDINELKGMLKDKTTPIFNAEEFFRESTGIMGDLTKEQKTEFAIFKDTFNQQVKKQGAGDDLDAQRRIAYDLLRVAKKTGLFSSGYETKEGKGNFLSTIMAMSPKDRQKYNLAILPAADPRAVNNQKIPTKDRLNNAWTQIGEDKRRAYLNATNGDLEKAQLYMWTQYWNQMGAQ